MRLDSGPAHQFSVAGHRRADGWGLLVRRVLVELGMRMSALVEMEKCK